MVYDELVGLFGGEVVGCADVGDSEIVGNGFREENPERRREFMMNSEIRKGSPDDGESYAPLALFPILVRPTFAPTLFCLFR